MADYVPNKSHIHETIFFPAFGIAHYVPGFTASRKAPAPA